MSKEWWEETPDEFADGFTEESQVHHSNSTPNEQDRELEAVYGPAAPFSEYHRNDHIRYISAEGKQESGTIVWVQARFQDIPMKYIVAPDEPGGFLDFVMPADVIAQE